jgi:hypothetical protein
MVFAKLFPAPILGLFADVLRIDYRPIESFR